MESTEGSKTDHSQILEENKQLREKIAHLEAANQRRRKRRWWIFGKLFGAYIGSDLEKSIRKGLQELDDKRTLTKDTLAEIIAKLFERFTSFSLLMLFVGLVPTFILFFQTALFWNQNSLVTQQNHLIAQQNHRLDQQTYLQEAERRGSLVFLFNNIMDAIDRELKDDYGKDRLRNLSPELIGRIIALSTRLKPYRYLEGDKLTKKALSPERGQLLVSLVESQLDTTTYDKIFAKANFSYADLQKAQLEDSYLKGVNLSYANLKKANLNCVNLRGANLRGANLREANLKKSILKIIDLRGGNLGDADLRFATLDSVDLKEGDLDDADLRFATLDSVDLRLASLKSVDLRHTNLVNTYLKNADLRHVNLNDAYLENVDLTIADARYIHLKDARIFIKNKNFIQSSKNIYLSFHWYVDTTKVEVDVSGNKFHRIKRKMFE